MIIESDKERIKREVRELLKSHFDAGVHPNVIYTAVAEVNDEVTLWEDE